MKLAIPAARRATTSILAAALVALTVLAGAAAASPAGALPPPCYPDCNIGSPPPPPPPDVTTIYGITPAGGWSGDQASIQGYDLLGAAVAVTSADPGVTIGGLPTILSNSNTSLVFNLPTIHSTTVGPVTLTITVSTRKGAASTTFSLSPDLTASASQTYVESNGAGDGTSQASFTVNRAAGTVTPTGAQVSNEQFWSWLSVNFSVVWLNAQDQVIGYTAPQNLAAPGEASQFLNFNHTGPVVVSSMFPGIAIGPDPLQGPWIHSARVVMVRDHADELRRALDTAFHALQTITTVLSEMRPYM